MLPFMRTGSSTERRRFKRFAKGRTRLGFAPHVILAIVGMISTGALMSLLSPKPTESPRLQQRRMIREISAVVEMVPGSWTFEDRETPWSADVADQFKPELCVDGRSFTSDGSERYEIFLLGPSVTNYKETIEMVGHAWKARGYQVGYVVPPSTEHPEIVAESPQGVTLSFSANAGGTSVSGHTQCFKKSNE